MNTNLVTNINADSTETVTAIAAQNFAFAQRVEGYYFIGEISFDVYCYGRNDYLTSLTWNGLDEIP